MKHWQEPETDEQDDFLLFPVIIEPKEKKQRHHENCLEATKNLARCLDKKRISPECVDFCKNHQIEALSRMLLALFETKIFVLQKEMLTNRWEESTLTIAIRQFGLHDEKDNDIGTIYKSGADEYAFFDNNAYTQNKYPSISDLAYDLQKRSSFLAIDFSGLVRRTDFDPIFADYVILKHGKSTFKLPCDIRFDSRQLRDQHTKWVTIRVQFLVSLPT